MTNLSCFKVFAILALASTTTLAQAASSDITVGQQLSAAEQSQYASAPSVRLDKQSFKVLSPGVTTKNSGAATSAVTTVIDERGLVGESRNEVIISRVTPDSVRQAFAQLSPAPVSVQYYDHLNISTLRFASFQDAVSVRDQLKKLLPQAGVDVPIRFVRREIR